AIVARSPKIHFALLALVVVGFVTVPAFRSTDNLFNVLEQTAALAILALGQSVVIAGGLIDLSVGQLVGLITVVACALMASHPELAPLIVLGVVVGAAVVGLANGELINRLKIPPLILTFGMLSVLQGAIFLVTDRSIGTVVPAVAWLANGSIAVFPASLFLVAIVGAGAYFLLQRSIFGWHLLALGNSAG